MVFLFSFRNKVISTFEFYFLNSNNSILRFISETCLPPYYYLYNCLLSILTARMLDMLDPEVMMSCIYDYEECSVCKKEKRMKTAEDKEKTNVVHGMNLSMLCFVVVDF
ncbi:hypothetical protein ACE6H2_026466 [Prunus campanulata]